MTAPLHDALSRLRTAGNFNLQVERWRAAADWTLQHEGGFVDDAGDPGGATQWGVSLRWLRSLGEAGDIDGDGDVDADDIRSLTRGQARRLYQKHFWEPYRFGEMWTGIGAKAFDISVNAGPRQAITILQRGIRACGSTIADDGVLGPITFSATFVHPPELLLTGICAEQAGFYRTLVATDGRRRKYETGWLRRAYARPSF